MLKSRVVQASFYFVKTIIPLKTSLLNKSAFPFYLQSSLMNQGYLVFTLGLKSADLFYASGISPDVVKIIPEP